MMFRQVLKFCLLEINIRKKKKKKAAALLNLILSLRFLECVILLSSLSSSLSCSTSSYALEYKSSDRGSGCFQSKEGKKDTQNLEVVCCCCSCAIMSMSVYTNNPCPKSSPNVINDIISLKCLIIQLFVGVVKLKAGGQRHVGRTNLKKKN